MDMETDVLRWFQQVADGTTVTEVSDLWQVSQPAVSRALARLEEEVGSPLLQRSGRVLRLTLAGAAFKRHVDALVNSLDDGLAAVEQLVDPESGTVTVAFQLSFGTWLVPAVVSRFGDRHPRVRFVLEQSHDALGSSLLSGGRVDLEFTARRPRNPSVTWQRLFTEPLGLAVPRGHRLADAAAVGLADVANEDFVMLRPPWALRATVDQLCAAAGFEPRVALEADDLPTVRGFVGAGLGVALVPTMTSGSVEAGAKVLARERGDGVVILPVTDAGASRDVGLAWSTQRRLLPSAELFRRFALVESARVGR